MIKLKPGWEQPNGKYKCPHCHKEYSKKGISTHIWRSHGDGVNHTPKTGMVKGRTPWNKGLTVNDSDILRGTQKKLLDGYRTGEYTPPFLGKKHKPETIRLLKENAGGYRKGSGRGKGGWYKNHWCDSTYELCWLIYQLDHNKTPIRNKKGYEYIYEGKVYKYYPDFILDDKIYEIKGYETNKDKLKYKSVLDKELIILRKKDLEGVFEYINNKYSKDHLSLYDDTKHTNYYQSKKKTCTCGNKMDKNSKNCKRCYRIKSRKIKERPLLEILLEDIKNLGYVGTGKKYGVSDNSIRNWIKDYQNG